MSIIAAYAVPHPPIVIPQVGRGKERDLITVKNFHKIAEMIGEKKPETIVLITPHGDVYSDYIHISPGASAKGSLAQFGAPEKVTVTYDEELISVLDAICNKSDFPAGTLGEEHPSLDHGTLVPLFFINQKFDDYKLIRISASGLSREDHYRFGMFLKEAAEVLGRKTIIVASGDLSHKLREDGPYGFVPEGPMLDKEICDVLHSGDFGEFFEINEDLRESGAECGMPGLLVMAGALDQTKVQARFLSYEGTLGVGYALAAFEAVGEDISRNYLEKAMQNAMEKMEKLRLAEDAYVNLARSSLEHYVRSGKGMKLPSGLPAELQNKRAGAFVSIKKNGMLRGCIGTTEPTRINLGEEILQNAVSACSMDPRFPPVEEKELPFLTVSVDVLLPPEPAQKEDLDPTTYGVIVLSGRKKGLLLPDLAGVDTVEEQLSIACRKAGIDPNGTYDIQRFLVMRHI